MGTRSVPGVKRPGRGVHHPPPSNAEVKQRTELYFCSPSRPLWSVVGWTLPFPFALESKINFGEEADEAAGEFTASACRLGTSKIAISDLNKDLPGLGRLLKREQSKKRDFRLPPRCKWSYAAYCQIPYAKEWMESTNRISLCCRL